MYKQNPKSAILKALKGNQEYLQDAIEAAPESPAKQVTAGEFAHEQSIKDKEMGKATYPSDKVRAALTALTSDNVTYAEAKKQLRKKRKDEYKAKK